jgi:hypothetical protein
MSGYDLQPNEVVIMRQGRISRSIPGLYTDELILTNFHIVHIGALGTKRKIRVLPLNRIKVFNGQVQALPGKQFNGTPRLDVYLLNGEEHFGFEIRKDVDRWVSNIENLVKGNVHEIDTSTSDAAESVADAFIEVGDEFKRVFGIKRKSAQPSTPEMVSGRCKYCGAPIAGKKGHMIHCSYCDGDQQL